MQPIWSEDLTSVPPASQPPRRSQAERSADSDIRLLTAAAEIIASEGYLAATLERVGERAGFSRGLASRKYGSKDGLIEAVIWHVSAHVNGQVDLVITGISDPLEQLLRLFDRFVELAFSDILVRAYFVLFSAMIANRLDTRSVFEKVQTHFGERIAELIGEAQLAGKVSSHVPTHHAAFMVGCLLAGISIEAMKIDPLDRKLDPVDLRRDLSKMLFRALGHD